VARTKNTAHKRAQLIAKFASDKKGEDIVILDMRSVSGVCDWFVLVSAGSTRQVVGIANGIEDGLYAKEGASPTRVEGKQSPSWVLMDYGDVVVHIFHDKVREYYGLEKLWSRAPIERYKEKCPKKTTRQKSQKSS